MLGLSKISESVLGWDKLTTFAIVLPVILFYVILSGYIGVVLSDLFQAIILIAASIMMMGLVCHDFGGPGGLYTALVNQYGEAVVSWHPPRSHELLGVVGVIAWTVGTAVGYGGDLAPMAVAMEGQRVLSCKTAREASKMYIWAEVTMFLMVATLTLPALAAMVMWPGLRDGSIDKELSYGMLIGHYLPPGVLGLALVALFASIMSTVDSNMNFGGQVFINDVYKRLIRPVASTRHYLLVGKLVMFVIMSLAILVATQDRTSSTLWSSCSVCHRLRLQPIGGSGGGGGLMHPPVWLLPLVVP
ncbi:hypothetical protein MYX78_04910 [Acidobacteria bacterium AH-259-G07]|nr:hypothetical protein [Acidobacteria bacterium AH-259-G07]